MASQPEFRRAFNIVAQVKKADTNRMNLFDVLDFTHTSQWWWKDHKKWFLYRHPYMSLEKEEGMEYLVYSKEIPIE